VSSPAGIRRSLSTASTPAAEPPARFVAAHNHLQQFPDFRFRPGGTPGAQLNQAIGMTDRIRFIKHEAVPNCGSFEVRFPDDRPTSVTGSLSSAFSSACSLQ
jgi:hypothetical protein